MQSWVVFFSIHEGLLIIQYWKLHKKQICTCRPNYKPVAHSSLLEHPVPCFARRCQPKRRCRGLHCRKYFHMWRFAFEISFKPFPWNDHWQMKIGFIRLASRKVFNFACLSEEDGSLGNCHFQWKPLALPVLLLGCFWRFFQYIFYGDPS